MSTASIRCDRRAMRGQPLRVGPDAPAQNCIDVVITQP
jgi:hypothetical protein